MLIPVPQIRTWNWKVFQLCQAWNKRGEMNSKASQSCHKHCLHLTNRLSQRRPPLYSFFPYGDRGVGWKSRQKRLWVRKDVHDKLSSIFERSETNCSHPVMMAIFSNFSHERSNANSVGSQIFFPLGILRPEIPARGTPRKIQRNLDTLLPSNTTATRFRIYVAVISSKKN